jgi:hypothetical protein
MDGTLNRAVNQRIDDELWTEKQFLAKIKICRAQLNKFKKKRLISYYKSGRRILYDSKSYEDFKKNCARHVESQSK